MKDKIIQWVIDGKLYERNELEYAKEIGLDTEEKLKDYWRSKREWIDSYKIDSELKLQEECTEEEYYKQQDSIREIMELNMVLYGKW